MIKLPYGWDSAVQAAKEANGNGSLNNMQIAASIILELDSQLHSPAQTKTVADAVEQGQPHFKATRENLDKIAKDAKGVFVEVEQEGEKWTHKFKRERCYIKVSEEDCEGFIVIVTETDGYLLCRPEEIKPIKQKRFTFNDGFIYDGDVRMSSSDIVNVMNFMVDELNK